LSASHQRGCAKGGGCRTQEMAAAHCAAPFYISPSVGRLVVMFFLHLFPSLLGKDTEKNIRKVQNAKIFWRSVKKTLYLHSFHVNLPVSETEEEATI
jgi:hypothetical protein